MNKKLLLLLLFMSSLSAIADRAMPGLWQTIRLSDGTEVLAELKGDEFSHYWQAADGSVFVYRGESFQRSTIEDVNAFAFERRTLMHAQTMSDARRANMQKASASFQGKKKGLIILVEFKDKQFTMPSPQTYYNRMANEVGFKDGSQSGSVHDYFYDQSYGQFDLTFDVVGPVKMSSDHTYYGQDGANGDIDVNIGSMLISAINMVDNQVNWADYDWNGDNEVEQIYFIYAGGGQATGAGANTIWPHKHNLRYKPECGGTPIVKQGITLDVYACSNEVNQNSKTAGIGTLCHEFSHCLGLPDMYDTSGNSGNTAANYGMGTWDIMNSGSYNNNGYTPAGYTSWERMMTGWLEPIELTTDTYVADMKPLTDGGESYVIYNPAFKNEYYLIENRAKQGWDRHIPAEGMLILHVDYNATIFNAYNAPNTFISDVNDHQRLTIFHADNTEGDKNETTDPYPYNNLNVLSNYSVPAATLHNANVDGTKKMNIRINRIKKNDDGTMSFVFGDWASADNSVLFAESFDDCNGTGANDGAWITFRTATGTLRADNSGWSASYIKGGRHCARIGNMAAEPLVSPRIKFNGSSTLTIRMAPFASEGTRKVVITTDNPSLTLSENTVTLADQQWTEFTAEVSGTGEAKLTISADCRLYIDDVLVCDNTVTGIENLPGMESEKNQSDNNVYDLQGRRINSNIHKGIYIKNGAKLIK